MADPWAQFKDAPKDDPWAQFQDAPQGAPQALQEPSLMDRAQANPIGGAVQTLKRSGQGLMQAAAHLPSLSGMIDPAIAEEKGNISSRWDQAFQGQNQEYEGAKQRVANASTDPRLSLALSGTGEGMGNLLNPTGMVGAGITNPILRGGVSAAGFAASQPVDDPSANFWAEKAKQQAVAVPTGMAMGAISAPPRQQVPTTEQQKAIGSGNYKAVENTPVEITPQMSEAIKDSYGRTAIRKALQGAEVNQRGPLADELRSLLADDVAQFPRTISAGAADKVSRAFRTLGSNAMRSDKEIGAGWFGRRGQVETALAAEPGVKDARSAWSKYEKSSTIDEAIQAADDASRTPAGAGGYDQALRREFGKIVKDKDLLGTFSEPEQAAIRRVSEGTFTSNALQQIGKMSPVRNQLTRALEMLGGIGGASITGDLSGSLPALGMAAVGEAGRVGAIGATSRHARLASELMRSSPKPAVPGPAPNVPAGNATSALLIQELLRPQRAY